MFNKFKHLILIFVIISIFLPAAANAFVISEIVAIPDTILGGISEANITTFQVVITFFLFYIIGVVSLLLSSNFLQSFISQQDQWMTNLEPMTQAGWNFTVGLSNMLLILIFLIIAFGFILKIESIQSKKALPKLLGVALLINFSWVFVRIFTDISHVIYNTLLPSESIFSMVIDVFLGPAKSIITTMMTAIGALVVSWAIPIANVFGQISFAIMFTVFFVPNIILWTFQAIFFYLLAGTFFTFAFLFAARVFVIQILIILSPLAFLSLILPQTKNFWSQWYKTLLEWLLLGIFFLFFLVLGFSTIKELSPTIGETRLPGALNMFQIGGYIAYYFAIFIYMAVILFIGKSFIPKGAKALIDFGTGIVSTVMTRGITPLQRAAQKRLSDVATTQQGKEDELKKQGITDKNMPRSIKAGRWMRRAVDLGHRVRGTTLNEENSKEISKIGAEADKINDPKLLQREINIARKAGNTNRELALTAKGISKGKGFQKSLQDEENIDKSRILSMAKRAQAMGRPDQAETLARGYSHILGEEEMATMTNFDAKKKEQYGTAKGMLFKTAKGDDLKQFKEGAWNVDGKKGGEIDESVLENLGGTQIGKMATEFDTFTDDFNKGAEGKDLDWFIEKNPSAALYLTGSPAGDLGLRPIKKNPDDEVGGEDRDSVVARIKTSRQKQRETEEKEKTAPEEYAAHMTEVNRGGATKTTTEQDSKMQETIEKAKYNIAKQKGAKKDAYDLRTISQYENKNKEKLAKEADFQNKEQLKKENEKNVTQKNMNYLRENGKKYQELKKNPLRSAEEQLRYKSYLNKIKEVAADNKKRGVSMKDANLQKQIIGDADNLGEMELADLMAREEKKENEKEVTSRASSKENYETEVDNKRIDLEKLENEYKAAKKADPTGFKTNRKEYEKEISNMKADIKHIKNKLK